jgi:hypothetical protein
LPTENERLSKTRWAACFGGGCFGKLWDTIRAGASLVAKGNDRIESGGAACGQPGCDGGNQKKEYGHDAKGGRVGGFDPDEHGSHLASDSEGGKEADGDTDDCEAKALANDKLEDVGGLSAEGHANADFGSTLADDGGEHAVESHAGEERGDYGEGSDEK